MDDAIQKASEELGRLKEELIQDEDDGYMVLILIGP